MPTPPILLRQIAYPIPGLCSKDDGSIVVIPTPVTIKPSWRLIVACLGVEDRHASLLGILAGPDRRGGDRLCRFRLTLPNFMRNPSAMSNGDAQEAERRASYQTLVRLANSCDRAGARGKAVSPLAADLNQEDYKDIADILRKLAETISSDLGG